MEQWAHTTDTGMSAAFGTLGMPVKVLKGMLEKEGIVRARFGIGLRNVEGNYKTKAIQSAFRARKLPPAHPYAVIMGAFRIRELFLDLANKGTCLRYVKEEGADLWKYLPGDSGLPGVKRGDAVIRTGDLKLAASLARVGLELLAVEGERNRRVFTLQAARPGVNGGELMLAWRADPESIPWENPFAQAMRGFHNRERLLDAVNRAAIKVTLIGETGRHAIVTSDNEGNVSGKAMKTACDFLE